MGKSKTKKSPFMMAKLDISKVCWYSVLVVNIYNNNKN
jgi:hypothetical protein